MDADVLPIRESLAGDLRVVAHGVADEEVSRGLVVVLKEVVEQRRVGEGLRGRHVARQWEGAGTARRRLHFAETHAVIERDSVHAIGCFLDVVRTKAARRCPGRDAKEK